MRRALLALLAPLAACTSSSVRLESSWTAFQAEYDGALEHARSVAAAVAESARAEGDDALLARVALPEGNPIARLHCASMLASLAYLRGDRASLEHARAAVRASEREVAELERAHAPAAPRR